MRILFWLYLVLIAAGLTVSILLGALGQ